MYFWRSRSKMTQAQKIIKFCAIALALFIIFSIITGIFSLMVNISYSFVSEEVGDFTTTTYDNVLNLNIDLPDYCYQIIYFYTKFSFFLVYIICFLLSKML